jgi:hypothetical protein
MQACFVSGQVWHVCVYATASALFWVMWVFAESKYYTTWALLFHAVYFMAAMVVRIASRSGISAFESSKAFVADGRFARWVFAPCLVTSVSVSTTVLYLMRGAWDMTWDAYCEGQKYACRDLITEFVLTHYFPPIILLLASATDDMLVSKALRVDHSFSTSDEARRIGRYALILIQLVIVPTFVYSSFYDPKAVYGSDNSVSTTGIYLVTNVLVSVAWASMRHG